ncbi:MAG: FhaA domain-containing protein [Nakamurella sp.]
MGIIQSFERRLQGAVGNTFARLFGGSVHPSEVITALQDEANNRLTQDHGRTVAPNHFKVRLGPTDRKGIGEDEKRVATALSDTIREYLAEQGYDTFGDVEVELEEAPSLHTGQFRVSSLVDPDAGPRRPSPPSGGRPVTSPSDPRPDQPYQPGPYAPPARQPYAEPQQQGYQHGYDPQAPAPQAYDPHRDARYSDAQQYGYGRQGYPDVVATLHADDGSGRSHQLQPGSNIVGRGQDASFRLPDTSVSRRHLDIYFDGHIAVMHDLGSTNGTTVNSTIVQTWQLADGDVVRLGHSTIIFSQRG